MSADQPSQTDDIDALIRRCLAGDQLAWEAIVRQYRRKVFKSLETFDRRANFQTWLISVSRNLCIDHYRSVRKERETIDRDVDTAELSAAAPGQSQIAALEQRDRVELLREALASLPKTLRTAVLMRDLQELSYHEIARELRLPEGTVKSRINRGRSELARQIKKLRGEHFSPSGISGVH